MNVISVTKKISLASHSAKEICMKPFEMKNFSVQYNLSWLPMVLFSYNRIYRDQTLSARITRGMFVASYDKIFHIQS